MRPGGGTAEESASPAKSLRHQHRDRLVAVARGRTDQEKHQTTSPNSHLLLLTKLRYLEKLERNRVDEQRRGCGGLMEEKVIGCIWFLIIGFVHVCMRAGVDPAR